MTEAFEQFFGNFRWMGWNLFLAIIPCVLSFILFNKQLSKRSPRQFPKALIWWCGFAIFMLFLPNAPYILTDIIHFVDDSRSPDISVNGIIFVLIPQYVVFLLFGFQCYVLSIIRFIQYFSFLKLTKNMVWLEISINFICAIAVYWGRFNRLNSWDVFTKPNFVISHGISNLKNPNFFFGTMLFFVVFTSLYYTFKWINVAIAFYWQNRPNQRSA